MKLNVGSTSNLIAYNFLLIYKLASKLELSSWVFFLTLSKIEIIAGNFIFTHRYLLYHKL
jgi:hypothetical protein